MSVDYTIYDGSREPLNWLSGNLWHLDLTCFWPCRIGVFCYSWYRRFLTSADSYAKVAYVGGKYPSLRGFSDTELLPTYTDLPRTGRGDDEDKFLGTSDFKFWIHVHNTCAHQKTETKLTEHFKGANREFFLRKLLLWHSRVDRNRKFEQISTNLRTKTGWGGGKRARNSVTNLRTNEILTAPPINREKKIFENFEPHVSSDLLT